MTPTHAPSPIPRTLTALAALALATALAGCATYREAALPDKPAFPAGVPQIAMNPADVALPALHPHPFDARDGLDLDEVAMLEPVYANTA